MYYFEKFLLQTRRLNFLMSQFYEGKRMRPLFLLSRMVGKNWISGLKNYGTWYWRGDRESDFNKSRKSYG